ncbi:lytic transglycosylase [Burkholderia sp. WAC0059]|uniref:lytic transglycosylase domain-containing protein n=1 Tax=Burkholderia sp. WAC0059 TaxID=2066022 RepID=UPI000C7EDCB3|nr:lytic transglycosylase domain-containing protein [Burkholderia sp. WAC0059]PLZ01774.1 lytic transglycosylase [Burkholderia sp. WAC0059]
MMSLAAFLLLAQQCAPAVAPATMAAVVRVESDFNPYAIGVVHGHLDRQPVSLDEARATVRALDAAGWNYSVGLAQVNRANWLRAGLTPATAFDPCRNLAAGAAILQGCFEQAPRTRTQVQDALRAGLSCYASGDFSTGYRTGYVQRVVDEAEPVQPVVPVIEPAVPPISVVPDRSASTATGTARSSGAPPPHPDHGTDWHPDGPDDATATGSAVVF